ncbi:MAG: PPC domain-containing DNA-binding protein [Pseudomonadota bacterium]
MNIGAPYNAGRRFAGLLPEGEDLIASIMRLCIQHSVRMAVFSIIGAVRFATYGTFDQRQKVYVTRTEEGSFDILSCTGNVSQKDGKPQVHAKILLGDEKGNITGGHLFSETLVFYAEFDLLEMIMEPYERTYDEQTGLFLWPHR